MASPKLSSDKMCIKSPKIVAIREKKLLTSPYTRPISSPRNYKDISRPFYSIVSDEPTVEYICMICLDYLQPNNTSFTSCGHIFHQNCLKLWYKNKTVRSCPLCRNDDIFDSALLPILPQPDEEKHEDFALYNDFESLQQCVMTSIFEMWPICNLSKRHPKELLTMAHHSLESSQKAFKSEQYLQAYRFLRRCIHFYDGILFCEHLNFFMKQHASEYYAMETNFENFIKVFDLKFTTFFSKVTAFKQKIYLLEKDFTDKCSTKFFFSL
jgi:hypothetical protein